MIRTLTLLCAGLLLAAFPADAQSKQNKSEKKEADLPPRDKNQIKFLAKAKLVNGVKDLLNGIIFQDGTDVETTNLINNSFQLDNNRIFYDDSVIIEDDIDPEHTSSTGAVEVPVERYLRALDLLYEKSIDHTIEITSPLASDIIMGDYPYIKVFYTIRFKGKYKSKPAIRYQSLQRVAELRAEKIGGKWAVFITRLAFIRPGEGLSQKTASSPGLNAATAGNKIAPKPGQTTAPGSQTIGGPQIVFVQPDRGVSVEVKYNRNLLEVLKSSSDDTPPGLYQRTGPQQYKQGDHTISFETKDRLISKKPNNEFMMYFRESFLIQQAKADSLKKIQLAAKPPAANEKINPPQAREVPTTRSSTVDSVRSPADALVLKPIEPSKRTAPTLKPDSALSGPVAKLSTAPGKNESEKKPPAVGPDLNKSLTNAHKQWIARYRTQGWLQIAGGLLALGGSYYVHSKIAGDYRQYTIQVDRLNTEYDAWRELAQQPAGERLTSQSMRQYGSPTIYAVYGGAALGTGLSVNGILRLLKAGKVKKKK